MCDSVRRSLNELNPAKASAAIIDGRAVPRATAQRESYTAGGQRESWNLVESPNTASSRQYGAQPQSKTRQVVLAMFTVLFRPISLAGGDSAVIRSTAIAGIDYDDTFLAALPKAQMVYRTHNKNRIRGSEDEDDESQEYRDSEMILEVVHDNLKPEIGKAHQSQEDVIDAT
ncbi:hypothetical protein C8R44DRAFT_745541 [Mycena epipterygia]|nr:hypothetical protein C8R44DRAFT_745541 [Mycena epipterygia]